MKIERIKGPTLVYNNTGKNKFNKNTKNNTVHEEILKKSITPPSIYGQDLINRNAIPTFRGNIAKTALNYALQIPVEDRLASIIQGINFGDIVLLGQDYPKALKELLEITSKIKNPIKKIIYLPDNKLSKNYAFFKNNINDIHLLNMNKDDLFIRVGNTHYSLAQGKSSRITNGNIIQYIGDNGAVDSISIVDKPKSTKLNDLKNTYSFEHEYTNEIEKKIRQINVDTIKKELNDKQNNDNKIDFTKIGGQKEAIKELKHGILFPVKYPEGFNKEDITRGYILYGPAGTGKTEISRALASEANINYMYMSGTEFENKYVGESEANVRAFFESLKENQPAIGVIDEIDAIGKERGDKDVYGAKVVNQILTSMTDLYNSGDNVFILGLTNKYETLDAALKRSERFSKHLKIDAPDREGTKEILKIHLKNKNTDKNLSLEKISDEIYKIKAVGAEIKYITKLARENMMNRLGIYEKMEKGTFTESDMRNARITETDFINAIDEFKKQHRSSRKTIGFNN